MADDECVLVRVENDQSIGSMPHSRCDCTNHPFVKKVDDSSHKKFCDNCYCFVCDVPAKDCKEWEMAGISENILYRKQRAHCHAYSREGLISFPNFPYYSSYVWKEKRKAKQEAAEKERKAKEHAAKAAAYKAKVEAQLKKAKVSFSCRCCLCMGLRQFIAGDAKELLLDTTYATETERKCFLSSVQKESTRLDCVNIAQTKAVVWKVKGKNDGSAVHLSVKYDAPKHRSRNLHSMYYNLYGGYGYDGYDSDGYDSDGFDREGYDCEGYDGDGVDRDGNHQSENFDDMLDEMGNGLLRALTGPNDTSLTGSESGNSVRKATISEFQNRDSNGSLGSWPKQVIVIDDDDDDDVLNENTSSSSSSSRTSKKNTGNGRGKKKKAASSSSTNIVSKTVMQRACECCGFDSGPVSNATCVVCGVLRNMSSYRAPCTSHMLPTDPKSLPIAEMTVNLEIDVLAPLDPANDYKHHKDDEYVIENWRINGKSWRFDKMKQRNIARSYLVEHPIALYNFLNKGFTMIYVCKVICLTDPKWLSPSCLNIELAKSRAAGTAIASSNITSSSSSERSTLSSGGGGKKSGSSQGQRKPKAITTPKKSKAVAPAKATATQSQAEKSAKKPPAQVTAESRRSSSRARRATVVAVDDADAADEKWVQCDDCKKWRQLPSSIDMSSLPRKWFCKLNKWDPKCSTCAAPELTAEALASSSGVEIEFNGEWFTGEVVAEVPAGTKVKFDLDSTTTVVPTSQVSARIRKPGETQQDEDAMSDVDESTAMNNDSREKDENDEECMDQDSEGEEEDEERDVTYICTSCEESFLASEHGCSVDGDMGTMCATCVEIMESSVGTSTIIQAEENRPSVDMSISAVKRRCRELSKLLVKLNNRFLFNQNLVLLKNVSGTSPASTTIGITFSIPHNRKKDSRTEEDILLLFGCLFGNFGFLERNGKINFLDDDMFKSDEKPSHTSESDTNRKHRLANLRNVFAVKFKTSIVKLNSDVRGEGTSLDDGAIISISKCLKNVFQRIVIAKLQYDARAPHSSWNPVTFQDHIERMMPSSMSAIMLTSWENALSKKPILEPDLVKKAFSSYNLFVDESSSNEDVLGVTGVLEYVASEILDVISSSESMATSETIKHVLKTDADLYKICCELEEKPAPMHEKAFSMDGTERIWASESKIDCDSIALNLEREVPLVHASGLKLLGSGSLLMCTDGSYASKKALKNPADNGGWASISTSAVSMMKDRADERERLCNISSINKTTVAAIMNEVENLGHRPAPQPPGLTVTMRDYQLSTLGFLLDQERLRGGIHRHFWVPVDIENAAPLSFAAAEKAAADNAKKKAIGTYTGPAYATLPPQLWYSPLFGEYRRTAPLVSYGGFLADEMGLGKTISTLALVKSNPAPVAPSHPTAASAWGPLNPEVTSRHHLTGSIRSGATLVICPVSLVTQWYDEACSKLADMGKNTVYRYYGGSRIRDPQKIANYDIVVTTYAVLASDWRGKRKVNSKTGEFVENESSLPTVQEPGTLQQVHWWRIVLDESHAIKDAKIQAARACIDLESSRRWCVTGSPLNGSTEDLLGQFKFLRLDSTLDSGSFRNGSALLPIIGKGKITGNSTCLATLFAVLRRIMIRHTKSQKNKETGKALLELPPKTTTKTLLTFSPGESAAYKKLEADAKKEYLILRQKPQLVMKMSLRLMASMIPLRQACSGGLMPSEIDVEKGPISDTLASQATAAAALADVYAAATASDSTGCAICHENIEDPCRTVCGHVFCTDCIKSLIGASQTSSAPCPTCKALVKQSHLKSLSSAGTVTVRTANITPEGGAGAISSDGTVMKTKFTALIAELRRVRDEDKTSKCLVFSQFKSTLTWLETQLPLHGFGFRTLQGDMTMTQRAKALRDFQNDPPTTIFLLSVRAGAVGINLTQANHVFLLEPLLNSALEEQAIGRVHRMGQKRHVKVIKLVMKDSIEERMVQLYDKTNSTKVITSIASSSSSSSLSSTSSSSNASGNSSKTAISIDDDTPTVTTGGIQSDKTALKIESYDALFGVTADDLAALTKKRDAENAKIATEKQAKKKKKSASTSKSSKINLYNEIVNIINGPLLDRYDEDMDDY